jgi:hypothetical protein
MTNASVSFISGVKVVPIPLKRRVVKSMVVVPVYS